MIEYAIITLITADGSWKEYFELPLHVQIKELEIKMVSVLEGFPMLKGFSTASEIGFQLNGKILDAERTLAEYQIWDGSILTIFAK